MIKKQLLLFFFFIGLPLGAASEEWVQCNGDLNVNVNWSGSFPRMAAIAGTLYVTWSENSGSPHNYYHIYCKRWSGRDWIQVGNAVNISQETTAIFSDIADVDGTLYIVWVEKDGTFYSQVYVKHWDGNDWIQDGGSLNVNANTHADEPKIASTNNVPYVIWYEKTSPYQVYVRHWDGNDWIQDGGALNVDAAKHACLPDIVDVAGVPYAGWKEMGATRYQLYVKHWDGNNWIQDGGSLNVDAAQHTTDITIASINNVPHIAWSETTATNNRIYVKHWDGNDWIQDGGALNVDVAFGATKANCAGVNGVPFVSFCQCNGPYEDIAMKYWDGNNWIQRGGLLNFETVHTGRSSVCEFNNTSYVVWMEQSDARSHIYSKYWGVATKRRTSLGLRERFDDFELSHFGLNH